MNSFYKAVFMFFIVLLPVSATAQSILLEGQVVDGDDLTPLQFAHIIKNKKMIRTAPLHAEFSVMVNPQDTLVISHVGYKKYIFIIPEVVTKHVDTTFFMIKDTTLLQEVKIHILPSEKEFKRQIMATDGVTKELINAQNNFALSQQLYEYGVVPEMNALDNYKTFIKGPQPVVFFSTNSSMGIGKALKRAFTSQSFSIYPQKRRTYNESMEFFKDIKITQKAPEEDQVLGEDSVKTDENLIVTGNGENR